MSISSVLEILPFFLKRYFESEISSQKLAPSAAQKKKVKLDDFNPQQLAEFLTVELVAQVGSSGGAKKS